MNDGSSDDTAAVARQAAAGDPRVVVVDRDPEIAGRGKGAVLNHAYRIVRELVAAGDPRVHGGTASDVVIGIVDADGWLEPHALTEVGPYFADARVGAVQLPVRIWNNRDGVLARLQDIEFVGFSQFVQAARDLFGSVGLGGNGQFSRLSALDSLGEDPWSRSLTEDLDLGLRLVERGWRNRFCPHAYVAQQAVTNLRPFFRQRTRWIQGHFLSWGRVPSLWRARGVPMRTRVDLSLYLLMVAFILILAVQTVVSLLVLAGMVAVQPHFLDWVHDPTAYRIIILGLSLGPLLAFAVTYQRRAPDPLPAWALPGMFVVFACYGYFWAVPASVRALSRIAMRRDGWVKTPRTAVHASDVANDAIALGGPVQ
jgi:cellulose synthase/poly-beta-1,6-N-acetylglucosamine synthase-like glycosyltransferase